MEFEVKFKVGAEKPPLSKTDSPVPGEVARSARRGAVAARLRAGRKGSDGLPQSPVPPLNSFHTVFHSDVENSYFSTVHNRLYMGQK